jgi:hypothetical protein
MTSRNQSPASGRYDPRHNNQKAQTMPRKSAPMTDAAVWKDARGHILIAGTVNGHKVISTVTSDPKSKRVHANLYRKLNTALRTDNRA